MALYIVNGNGNFFEISGSINLSLETDLIYGCRIFNNLDRMVDYVSEVTDEDPNEIRGGELVIKMNDKGDAVCVDARGCVEYITDDLETFIADYVV